MKGDRSSSEARFIDSGDVIRIYPIPSRDALYERVRRGTFPRPFRLGRTLLWRPEDVEAFIEENLDGEGSNPA